jgi:hypothetical protein
MQSNCQFIKKENLRIIQQRGGYFTPHSLSETQLPDRSIQGFSQVQQFGQFRFILPEDMFRNFVYMFEQLEQYLPS